MRAVVAIVVGVSALGCSSANPQPDAGTDAAADALDDVIVVPTSRIGNACTRPTDPSCVKALAGGSRGDCAAGQICILPTCELMTTGVTGDSRVVSYGAWGAGYCVQSCAGTNGHPDSSMCPSDALCSSSDRMETQQCLRACTSDADCRASEGYSCQVDGLGAYADQHLPTPRGQTHACRPNTACAASGAEPDGAFLNQPIPLATNVVGAAEGNVAFDGNNRAVVTYIGDWRHDGLFDTAVVAASCTMDTARHCTWSAPTLNHFTRSTDGFVTDPAVTFDAATGDYYWSWLDYVGSGSWMRVARSVDGGATWSAPVDAAAGVEDKPWVTARNGIVFAVVDDAGGALRIARSIDSGQTWEEHQLAVAGEAGFYPQASVDASGNLFLAWASATPGPPATATDSIRVAMWPAGTSCAVLPATEDCFIGKSIAVESTLFAKDRIDEVPFSAALHPDGSYWIAYVRGSRYIASDVVVVKCVVGTTTTCGAPVRVSQPSSSSCGVRILPAITFDPSGTAHVVWMDGRYGKGDRGRWWYATSPDGKAWTESVMSDADGVFTVGKEWSAGWAGDYPGVAAANGRVVATWADTRALAPTGIQPGGDVRARMFLGVR